ncbi:MAG: N-6 DNA methylase [Candidatus Nanoarchaeia archaeon]|nr:N-6 DNA methylase [Candidatus Nanoarchaeia archaeon]
MIRKNESQKDILLFNYLKDKRSFQEKWNTKKTTNKFIQPVLDTSSKKKNGQRGEPDFVYVNEKRKILILIENKDDINQHKSKNEDNPITYSVDGIKHYLSCFKKDYLENFNITIKKYLNDWKIVGIAVSGNIEDEYNHLISTYTLQEDEVKDIETEEILNEEDYLSLFENINLEKITRDISLSSNKINNLLRSLDSQKRPILLSALMICLFEPKNIQNDFKNNYSNWTANTIITNIPLIIKTILGNEGIPSEKIEVLNNELTFIKTDLELKNTDILKDILNELENNVIPQFNKSHNYDIIGKFYEDFLRYAGVTNVKKGIILTPAHITKLFTELIDVKTNDVIIDTCCGTGAFLISAMNKIIEEITDSSIKNKKDLIDKVKHKQLIGIEKNTTMYTLAISNMLFRGDGKSNIYHLDSFSKEADKILLNLKKRGIIPTIGFINPPYGGRDNKENPTKKEIQFLERLLDNVSRYGIIIAPLSTYFKEEIIRSRILSKHTLKYVINMPKELFQPNASTHTAIAVFKTNLPHNNKEVIFYNLQDDGLVLSKNRGRTDALNKWAKIKKELLTKLNNPKKYADGINLVITKISNGDEWILQAHAKTDYTKINERAFINSIKQYIIFSTKRKLGLLDRDIDEITLLEILNENKINANALLRDVKIKEKNEKI